MVLGEILGIFGAILEQKGDNQLLAYFWVFERLWIFEDFEVHWNWEMSMGCWKLNIGGLWPSIKEKYQVFDIQINSLFF